MQREIEHLTGHTIVCGFGRMGSMLAESLSERKRAFVLIDTDKSKIDEAAALGYLALQGDATHEDVLKLAGIEKAGALATVLSSDVNNVFITITARGLHPDLQIIARAEQPSTTKKLKQVGATNVILPAAIGADRLANMILRPSAESLLQQAKLPEGLNEDLAAIGLRLDELEIEQDSKLVGGRIHDIHVRGHRGFLIVAIRRQSGQVIVSPDGNEKLKAGDCLIVLGSQDDIPELCSRYALRSEKDADDLENSVELNAESLPK